MSLIFSIPHAELMKQTVHKKLEDISIKTEEGTVKLTDFSMNKLQSIIAAEIPEELEEKLYKGNEMMLMGTDSKGNQVQYELRSNSADGKSQWSFKTSFWGMYQLDSDGPVLYSRILTAIIWNYSFIPESLIWLLQTLSGLMTIL